MGSWSVIPHNNINHPSNQKRVFSMSSVISFVRIIWVGRSQKNIVSYRSHVPGIHASHGSSYFVQPAETTSAVFSYPQKKPVRKTSQSFSVRWVAPGFGFWAIPLVPRSFGRRASRPPPALPRFSLSRLSACLCPAASDFHAGRLETSF